MKFAYPYTVTPQAPSGFFIQFMDLEEAFTEGATLEEAAFNASEVLSGVLAYRIDEGQSVPEPSAAGVERVATPSAVTQLALQLHQGIKCRDI
jgi:antitoxin HicB